MFILYLLLSFLAASRASVRAELSDASSPDGLVCESSTFNFFEVDPDVQILSITAERKLNYTSRGGIPPVDSVDDLKYCQVKVYLNHLGSDDSVLVEIWLPTSRNDWNGRFQATGGGAYATGMFDMFLVPAVQSGYAVSATDGGHEAPTLVDLDWAVASDGTIRWDLLLNFSSRSLVEQVIVGKRITEQFYGSKPHHSYWNGCSQGGRQGYVIAQKYPHLLDGILANAPAISFTDLVMGMFWPQLVMKEAGLWMSSCEFEFFRQKAMEECDMLDGVSDGIIGDPDVCDFDPLHIIGKPMYCDGKEVEVTSTMAEIVRRIEQGPRSPFKAPIWHGLAPGTSMLSLAYTETLPDGVRVSKPSLITSNFIQILLLKDPTFNVTKLSYGSYMALWTQASHEYGWILDADDPDLSYFNSTGAKLLTWHGINDPLIPYQNTIQYRKRVEQLMGGAQRVDSFYRLFLAPGVEHCGMGSGPVPQDPLTALVDWVERGEPPETISATATSSEGDLVTRELCAWPAKAKYMGIGDAKRASSWSCVGGTERPEVEFDPTDASQGRAGEIISDLKDRLEGLGLGLNIG